MAKNTGKGHRKGIVANRTQCHNEKTGMYMKRDAKTGKFISGKKTKYKGIRTEKMDADSKKEKVVEKIVGKTNKSNTKTATKNPAQKPIEKSIGKKIKKKNI